MNVGQIERATQDRVVALFRDTLGYEYLGNWEDRDSNRNIVPDLLRVWLDRQGYDSGVIGKALYELDKVAGDTSKSLYSVGAWHGIVNLRSGNRKGGMSNRVPTGVSRLICRRALLNVELGGKRTFTGDTPTGRDVFGRKFRTMILDTHMKHADEFAEIEVLLLIICGVNPSRK